METKKSLRPVSRQALLRSRSYAFGFGLFDPGNLTPIQSLVSSKAIYKELAPRPKKPRARRLSFGLRSMQRKLKVLFRWFLFFETAQCSNHLSHQAASLSCVDKARSRRKLLRKRVDSKQTEE